VFIWSHELTKSLLAPLRV